jgi:hypothetical protein
VLQPTWAVGLVMVAGCLWLSPAGHLPSGRRCGWPSRCFFSPKYRRSDGECRLQLKWLYSGAVVFVVCLTVTILEVRACTRTVPAPPACARHAFPACP